MIDWLNLWQKVECVCWKKEWCVIHWCFAIVLLCGTRCVDARSLWTVRHSSGCPGLQGQRFRFHKVRHSVSLFVDIVTREICYWFWKLWQLIKFSYHSADEHGGHIAFKKSGFISSVIHENGFYSRLSQLVVVVETSAVAVSK